MTHPAGEADFGVLFGMSKLPRLCGEIDERGADVPQQPDQG